MAQEATGGEGERGPCAKTPFGPTRARPRLRALFDPVLLLLVPAPKTPKAPEAPPAKELGEDVVGVAAAAAAALLLQALLAVLVVGAPLLLVRQDLVS